MIFSSLSFIFFYLIIYSLYWLIPSRKYKYQNFLLLISSFFFYGIWSLKFLALLIFSIFFDYLIALKISKTKSVLFKKIYLINSLVVSFGLLFYFKYFNFFIESFVSFFNNFGLKLNYSTLNIILPVGISFYTFHSVSYIVDNFRGKIPAEKNIVNYALFVSFFPLLVAGPIERATHLLPQIKKKRKFEYSNSVDGLKQILWGFFKKIVIADSCAIVADNIFNDANNLQGATLVFGAFIFAIQIYGDFSGYSDIALGVAKLIGFTLLDNFKFPYFSRDIAEFWRRWHISLSSWFKDYLYIPLGGSKISKIISMRNTFIIFLLSGFWHGANWTFICWGGLHALYFIPLLLTKKNRVNFSFQDDNKPLPSLKDLLNMFLTFILVSLAWIFFRSENVTNAIDYINNLFRGLFVFNQYISFYNYLYWNVEKEFIGFVIFMFIIEWKARNKNHALEKIGYSCNGLIRFLIYTFILLSVFFYIRPTNQTFIYFQF
jgi:alginate O-acetyltransferase complex protein AlgI